MIARPYQLECLEAIWNDIIVNDTALVALPTGSGKTFIFSHLIKRSIEIKHNIKIVIAMGRIDLVKQTEQAIARVIDRKHIGVYCGSLGRKEISRIITVASIQSIESVLLPNIDLMILDEAHNLDQKNGSYLRFINKCLDKNPKLKIVGFTATPFRSTGTIYGEDKLFKKISYKKTVKEMIAMQFLCEPKMKSSQNCFDTSQLRIRSGEYMAEDITKLVSDKELVRQQVEDAISRMKDRNCIVWATANIDHCNMVADVLMSMNERCTTIHSKLSKDTRSRNLSAFIGGSMRHMSFVTVLSEGFDHPPIDCVVLMRPTRSPVLYVQTVGRGLRPYPGKKECLILDYGQVILNLGPLDDPNVKGKKKDADGEAVLKECPKCFSYVFGGFKNCPECGHEFPPPSTPIEKLDKKSYEGNILSEKSKPETIIAGPIVISMHQSKSGNECVRITYQDRNIITRWGTGGVSEYFVTNNAWALERLERRLSALNIAIPSIPFAGEITINGTFEILKTIDGKYDRVLSVKKIANESPVTEYRKTYLDQIDDELSFDFGMNAKEM